MQVCALRLDYIVRARWDLVPLVLLLGFGSHTISHALAPAEPLLNPQRLGLHMAELPDSLAAACSVACCAIGSHPKVELCP